MSQKKGFTLIEILIVVILTALFLAMTVPFTINFYQQRLLDEETSKLANNLKIAQSRSITGKNNSSWGIRFFEDHYTLFMGDYYDEVGRNEEYDQIFSLKGGMTIEGVLEVVFEKNIGNPNIISAE